MQSAEPQMLFVLLLLFYSLEQEGAQQETCTTTQTKAIDGYIQNYCWNATLKLTFRRTAHEHNSRGLKLAAAAFLFGSFVSTGS